MSQTATSLKPNILIAPLDWGLGHATRCIPVINQLIQQDCHVLIACGDKIKILLEKEFPDLSIIPLSGYGIRYSRSAWSLPLQIGKQIPKIISAIQYENERLKEIVKEQNIHGIISDNRYGFYHQGLPSVFITHQLTIKTPFGPLAEKALQKINYRFINRFSECWVPDNEHEPWLAGDLSHPQKKPSVPLKYIDPLSRMKANEQLEKHLLVLISGPEPQRSVFEELMTEELDDYKAPVVLVRGLPGSKDRLRLPGNISVYDHLPAIELNQKMNEAGMVISRCGYSTVMDLATLEKKSILIPTPGQTEQQYLASQLMKNNFALCLDQEKFRLKNALELASHFPYRFPGFNSGDALQRTVEEFVNRIKAQMK